MKNITFGLLVATMLTSAATGAYANSDTFKAINPNPGTPANTIKNGQKGTNNVITGRVTGSGNAFALTQVGVNNHTSVNAVNSLYISNSKVVSVASGNGNDVNLNLGGDSSQGNTVNNAAINTSVKGDMNKIHADVYGSNTAVALNVKGASNKVAFDVAGHGSSNVTNITGNDNVIQGSQGRVIIQPVANAVKTTISGNGNTINNEQAMGYNTITESFQGDGNNGGVLVAGVHDVYSVRQLGDNSFVGVLGYDGGSIDYSNMKLSSDGDNNQVFIRSSGRNAYDNYALFVKGTNNDVSSYSVDTRSDTVSQTVTGDRNTAALSQYGAANSQVSQTISGSGNILYNTQYRGTTGSKTVARIDGDDNLASLAQSGNSGAITFAVGGSQNKSISVSQMGDNDVLTLKVNGNANIYNEALQVKVSNSVLTASVTGNGNSLSVIQGDEYYANTGSGDNLTAAITGSYNVMKASQVGNNNKANLSIKGNGDTIMAQQVGGANILVASITDGGIGNGSNLINADQSGNGNTMHLMINGGQDDQLSGTQNGDGNTMYVKFTGSGNRGEFTQTGDGLKYSLNSNKSNKIFKVDQHN